MGLKMSSKVAVAAMAAVFTVAAAVSVQAADKIKVVETAKFDAPVAKVWEVVGDFTSLAWHPAVKSATVSDGNKVGSQRQLDLGGPVLVEELIARDVKHHSYTYKILDNGTNQKILPVSGYVSTLQVKKSGTGSIIVWKSSFHAAPDTDPKAAETAIHGVYRGGLDNLPKVLSQN